MADTPKVYVLCDQNCKYEGMTKEQIITAIMQAVENGEITDLDTGFITTVKTINGHGLKFFVGEQHEYEALTVEQKENLFAIITNDTLKEGLLDAIADLERTITENEAMYSKKAEARQVITDGFPSKALYGSSEKYQYVDLSSIMLQGKTATDTIGIGVRLNVAIDEQNVDVALSVLWNINSAAEAFVNTFVVSNSKVYLLGFDIGINPANMLYCRDNLFISGVKLYCYNITDNKAANVSYIGVKTLNIFYK